MYLLMVAESGSRRDEQNKLLKPLWINKCRNMLKCMDMIWKVKEKVPADVSAALGYSAAINQFLFNRGIFDRDTAKSFFHPAKSNFPALPMGKQYCIR